MTGWSRFGMIQRPRRARFGFCKGSKSIYLADDVQTSSTAHVSYLIELEHSTSLLPCGDEGGLAGTSSSHCTRVVISRHSGASKPTPRDATNEPPPLRLPRISAAVAPGECYQIIACSQSTTSICSTSTARAPIALRSSTFSEERILDALVWARPDKLSYAVGVSRSSHT